MAKKKQVSIAREAALAGDVDGAIPLLLECSAAGDDAAAASLAELLAFLDRWEEVIPCAARLIANPFAVYAGNVFDDMVRLLGRAGHETSAWGQIFEVAMSAHQCIEERLQANEMNYPAPKLEATRDRLGMLLDRLAEYATSQGKTSALVEMFIKLNPNKEAFEAALVKNKGKPASRLLDLAIAFSADAEAIKLYSQVDNASFDQATYVAQALVRSGDLELAWQIISTKAPNWYPVDPAQVAPVILLVDAYLSQIVTTGRALDIVRTPRSKH